MTDDIDTLLSPEKLEAAIRKLEAEKARRAEGKPAIPEAVVPVRHFVEDQPARVAPPAPPKAGPRPRKNAKKLPKARTPVPFFTQTAKPINGDAGSIEEGWFVTEGKRLALCGPDGEPSDDWHPIHERGEQFTARRLLREKLAARRGPGPNHDRIVYPKVGWR